MTDLEAEIADIICSTDGKAALITKLAHRQVLAEDRGAREAAQESIKIIARNDLDTARMLCDFFAKTRQWGEFQGARFGQDPAWMSP
jgi:hypothetical protein